MAEIRKFWSAYPIMHCLKTGSGKLLMLVLWDFDFLRGLAPGRLDGFSIGRYEKNRESFDLYAAKFESKAMRFWGKKSPRRWNAFKRFQNKASTLVSL